MRNKFNTIIMLMFLVMTCTFSSSVGSKVGRMSVIENNKLSSIDFYDDGNLITVTEDSSGRERISSTEDINIQIANHILKFEGSKLINNTTEYSKYGITSQAMKRYNNKYKTSYAVEKLGKKDAVNIIVNLMKEYRVTEIKDPRIRVIVFDTMFNTGNIRAGKITQRAINFYNNIKHRDRVTVDGIIGSGTIKNLNDIEDVDLFVKLFIYERINSYRQFREWDKYGNGWTLRIVSVGDFKV